MGTGEHMHLKHLIPKRLDSKRRVLEEACEAHSSNDLANMQLAGSKEGKRQ
jgi:hypothetical protein